MKKTYTKPALRLEYFTLTQSIARSCGWNDEDFFGSPTHGDNTTCGWKDVFGQVYWVTPAACEGASNSPDLVIDEVCYNNPNGQPLIFAS